MTDILNIDELKKTLVNFSKRRKWEKFHSPKNLAMAMAGEMGELLELFQWLTEKESFQVKNNPSCKEKVAYELADILLYAVHIASQLDINLNTAIFNKIAINNKKYPVNKVKGSAKKYTEYYPS